MIQDQHRTRVLEAMPEPKARAKRARTTLGIALAGFGVLTSVGAFATLILLILSGGTLDKWAAGLIGVLFLGGMATVAIGSHVMSGELVGAAWLDLSESIRRVWRRNGGGS